MRIQFENEILKINYKFFYIANFCFLQESKELISKNRVIKDINVLLEGEWHEITLIYRK